MDELIKFREEIDKIDNELVVLFEKRIEIAKRIAQYKSNKNIPIYDEVRENAVVRKSIEKLKDKSLSQELESFYMTIFEISKEVQRKVLDSAK